MLQQYNRHNKFNKVMSYFDIPKIKKKSGVFEHELKKKGIKINKDVTNLIAEKE